MLVTRAINAFLSASLAQHPGHDLLERFLSLGGATTMEMQVNAAAGNGEPVEGKRSTWTDGVNSWWSIRCPKNANAEPEWNDYELRFPLEEHAEGIGSTGWDWVNRRSRYFGFDFDSITGHAKGIGVTDAQLAEVCEAAKSLPYVETRLSTGGKGIHLYVYFDADGVATANHTEHAALARCVLGMMSAATGFDFASQIDACGHIMWLWHRKMTTANQGLSLVRVADTKLRLGDLPTHWRDHVEVVARRRAKVRLNGLSDSYTDQFDILTDTRRIVPLDAKHKAIIQALSESGASTLWVQDHHLLQTHTVALQRLIDDPKTRNDLGLIGYFKTISGGKDLGTPNCFLFPLLNGGWRVYRFSPGINEAEIWTQDSGGWTTTYFNRLPDFETACRASGGVKDPETGVHVFDNASAAIHAADLLGQKIDVDAKLHDRETRMKVSRDGKLLMIVQRSQDTDPDKIPGWLNKKTRWVREYTQKIESNDEKQEPIDYDGLVRFLVTPDGKDAGVVVRGEDKVWIPRTRSDAKMVLQSVGLRKTDAEAIMGGAVLRPWTAVTLPFGPEYPGARQWNMSRAQFTVQPVYESPVHPHWDMVFNHLGTDLDEALKKCAWAKESGITTGGQYLRTWAACAFREPFEPLPYLFFWGPQGSGKSIFHEALQLLVTGGVVMADRSLTNSNDFNGELLGAVVCVIEEKNVAKAPGAYAKIKAWTTGKTLSIRRMRTDSFDTPNTTHWIQAANEPENCPLRDGDTRVTVISVRPLSSDKKEQYPKSKLMAILLQEAPHFLRTLLDLELPPLTDRLRLEVVATDFKRQLASDNDPEAAFLADHCHVVSGERVGKKALWDRYVGWCYSHGHDPKSQRSFGWAVMRVFAGRIRNTDKLLDGLGLPCYTNLQLRG